MARRFLEAVETYGVILVHDKALPSITAVAAGKPVAGSWWSHPLANSIYNALGAIEHDVLEVRLICGKVTLVAQHLWPAIVAIGSVRSDWRLRDLPSEAIALLASIEDGASAVAVDASRKSLLRGMAERLLVFGIDIHTPIGRHETRYSSWSSWAEEHVVAVGMADEEGRRLIEAAITSWPSGGATTGLLPW